MRLETELALPTDRALVTTGDLAERALADPTRRVAAVRAGGGAAALVIRQLVKRSERAVIALTPSAERARQLEADLRFFTGDLRRVLLFDAGDLNPYAEVAVDRRAAQLRLAALFTLASAPQPVSGGPPEPIVVVPAAALAGKVVRARDVLAASRRVRLYESVDRDGLVEELVGRGYVRAPLVEDPGTVAARGSLVDVWPVHLAEPVRIELDGDLVSSMKRFDPIDQRTRGELEELWIPPGDEARIDAERAASAPTVLRDLCDACNLPSARTRALIEDLTLGRTFFGAQGFLPAFAELAPLHEQLPEGAIVVVEEPSAVRDAVDQATERAAESALEKRGQPHYPLSAFFVDGEALDGWLGEQRTVAMAVNPVLGGERSLDAVGAIDDDTPSLTAYDQAGLIAAVEAARKGAGQASGLLPVVEHVRAWQGAGLRVIFSARTLTQAERLTQLLSARGLPVQTASEPDVDRLLTPSGGADLVYVIVSDLTRGTLLPAEGLALVTEEEVFGSRAHRRARARTPGKRQQKRLLEDLRSLAVGDHVVHVEHGIGRYEGLIHREVGGHTLDMLVVSYAGGDKLYVPVYRLNLIQKLRGGEGSPKLDRLGGKSFARVKARARKKVRNIADQLLRLYAERQNATGRAIPPVNDEYRTFEATFPYEETDDQARTIAEVAADLESHRPMDRLVCGDVGFGKTEVALRAAFRVAMTGGQVAVLCPTTVLAQQHKMTFDTRLSAYPLTVEVLSRFRSKREVEHTLRGLREGSVDVVIGTHRLLSKDVHFKRLGLLVVDEEQRFGVTAKERIKELRTNVDVLTLSATPIPRTMQMAISGLRDLSVMTTPPADRRAVRTIVTRRDRQVLKSAIERELGRGGQVFFVYNRIGGLAERAALVEELVPRARVAVAHGRMSEGLLEETMLAFVEGQLDVLVTTAIIENGLDIPRANTILVDHADLLGLGQLYQLRGRVGRSKERGYCYLVLPEERALTDEARTRIEALQRYSDLGSGMLLASLDLDLRGAGDLLGAEQTGAVASVGFDMFCSMLEEAAAELRGETVTPDIDPDLSFDVEALLPEAYVPEVGVRLSLYKRLASAEDEEEVQTLAEEMEDRFGRPPAEARRFIQLMQLKVELRRLRVLACEASTRAVTLHLRNDTPLDPTRLAGLLQDRRRGYRLSPDMRLTRKLPPESFASGLEATAHVLDELSRALDEGSRDAAITSAPSSPPR